MLLYVMVCLLGAAAAAPAPWRPHRPPPPWSAPRDDSLEQFFHNDMFDTQQMWRELSTEMKAIETLLQDFQNRFAVSDNSETMENGKYTIKINLPGYDETDFVVKANNDMAMIQAVHKTASSVQRNYLDLRGLPKGIDTSQGTWTYDNGVLEVVFPAGDNSSTSTTTTEAATSTPHASREEMEEQTGGDSGERDVDVGLGADNDLLTNEIPRGDRPKHANSVYLSDDVEFVPVRY